MATTDLTKNNKLTLAAGLSLVFLPFAANGAEVGGSIRIGVSHTDNVFLVTSPDEMDDTVYQASPSLTVVHESPTFDAMLDYTFDWYKYADVDSTAKYHRGEGSITGKAWGNSLLVELGARRSQALSDPDDVIPSGNLPLSGNLTDEDEFWINPRLSRALGSAVTLGADYRYSKIQYDDSEVQDNDNQLAVLSLDNYRIGRGLTWALRYNWSRTEYDISAPWEYQQASGELGFWATTSTRVFGSGGKESAWDKPFDPAMDDSFWEVGFAHTAGENFSAEFAAGERSFGSSWRGNLDYTFRRGSTSFSYDESPTTEGYDTRGTGGITNPFAFDDFLDSPGSAERYLSERLQWSLDLAFRRMSFDLALFDEDRSGRRSATGEPLDDQSETGVRASLSWQIGARTDFVFSGSLIDQKTGDGDKSKYKSAGFDVNYTLGAHSDLSLGYSYDEQQPHGDNSTSRDYVSNVITLSFTYTM